MDFKELVEKARKERAFKTAKEVQEIRKNWWLSEKAEEILKAKAVYPHIKLNKLPNGKCPIGQPFKHCIECDYTDKIGACCHPINIQKEITEGRAMPYIEL